MEKLVRINIDTKIARTMLGVSGYGVNRINAMTDDNVFQMVLNTMECYGATSTVEEQTTSTEQEQERIVEFGPLTRKSRYRLPSPFLQLSEEDIAEMESETQEDKY